MDRWIIGCAVGLALLVVGSLGLSGPLLERMLAGPVEYTERSRWRCEYSPAGPVLDTLPTQERVPYERCDLSTCLGIEATVTSTARRLHDRSMVQDC
jgi:hypothetical protein